MHPQNERAGATNADPMKMLPNNDSNKGLNKQNGKSKNGQDSGGRSVGQNQNKRRNELKAVFFNSPVAREKYQTFDVFVATLRRNIGGHDPFDRNVDIGPAMKWTYARMRESETRWNAWRRSMGYLKEGERPSRFTTIRVIDMTPAELATARRRDRNVEQAKERKAARLEKGKEGKDWIMDFVQTANEPLDYAGIMAAQKAATKARKAALLEAIGDSERTTIELITAMLSHPAWHSVDRAKFRRAVYDRLDELEDDNRIVTARYLPGRRGSHIRVVRRVKK